MANATDNQCECGRRERQILEAGQRDGHDLRRQDEVGADRSLDLERLEVGRVGHGVDQLVFVMVIVEQDFGDLLGRLEGQVGTADHQ